MRRQEISELLPRQTIRQVLKPKWQTCRRLCLRRETQRLSPSGQSEIVGLVGKLLQVPQVALPVSKESP